MKIECPLLYERVYDINNWVEEYNKLYNDFKREYIESHLTFYSIPIQFKRIQK